MSLSQNYKDSISSKVTSEVCNGSDLGQKVNIIQCTIENVKKRKLQKNGKTLRHRTIINVHLSNIGVQNATFCKVLKDTCCHLSVEILKYQKKKAGMYGCEFYKKSKEYL